MTFPAYERVSAEVGQKQMYLIWDALTKLLPCPRCGAGVGRPCVTVDGKAPGTPVQTVHISRQRSGSALKQIWLRMANEAFEKIDNQEIPCLEKLTIRE
jgi:hypothetical protein